MLMLMLKSPRDIELFRPVWMVDGGEGADFIRIPRFLVCCGAVAAVAIIPILIHIPHEIWPRGINMLCILHYLIVHFDCDR